MHTHRDFRDQAHRAAPERLTPAMVVAFLLALAGVMVFVALFLATGEVPA